MQRRALFWALGLLTVAVIYGCGDSASRPQAGDTVTPVVGQKLTWTAGSAVALSVRLEATGKDGARRPLGFSGIRNDPVANVVFYEGDEQLASQEVKLSHRC